MDVRVLMGVGLLMGVGCKVLMGKGCRWVWFVDGCGVLMWLLLMLLGFF